MKLNWPDTFSVVEMTDAVNKLPLMPLRFGGMFETTGIPTTHMAFDYKRGRINLIPDSPRGSNPEYVTGKGGEAPGQGPELHAPVPGRHAVPGRYPGCAGLRLHGAHDGGKRHQR